MKKMWNLSSCRFLQSKVEKVLCSPLPYIPKIGFERYSFKSQKCSKNESALTTDINNTPEEFREPYIYRGYRTRTDFLGSIRSLFYLHNESFNCWSHILGLLIVLLYVLEEYISPSSNPIMCIYLFGCIWFIFGSSFGHTFCCYDRFTRHISFTIDYIGLTIFTCCSGIAYVSFSFPLELQTKPGLFGFSFLETYLIILSLCSMISIYQAVWTRTLPPSVMRSVIRVSAFASPGLLMSAPISYKIFQCFYGSSVYPPHYCDSSTIWPKQFIACITSCLFYISRFPECIYPGKFDYFGHSHNVFHIGALLGLHYQKNALSYDLKFTLMNNLTSSIPIQIPLVCLTFIFLSILVTLICFRHLFSVKHRAPTYKSKLL